MTDRATERQPPHGRSRVWPNALSLFGAATLHCRSSSNRIAESPLNCALLLALCLLERGLKSCCTLTHPVRTSHPKIIMPKN
jgi:hypothetical protein